MFIFDVSSVTPPLPVTVEVRILLPYDFKQTTLDGDKQLGYAAPATWDSSDRTA